MDLRKLSTLLLSFWCIIVFAQPQEVISPLGNSYYSSNGSISFTLGEIMIKTFDSPELILTQGFHQSRIVSTDIRHLRHQDLEILVYPNPAKDFVLLKVGTYEDFSFVLFDITGRIIEKKEVVSTETKIDFNHLKPSIYVLKVFRNEEDVRSFRITKF